MKATLLRITVTLAMVMAFTAVSAYGQGLIKRPVECFGHEHPAPAALNAQRQGDDGDEVFSRHVYSSIMGMAIATVSPTVAARKQIARAILLESGAREHLKSY